VARFDWVRFLNAHRIEFVERGANVARGNIAINCPWCGDADRGFHLGISLGGKGYGCWRSKSHRGIRPTRLIAALLKCSWDEAKRISGDDDVILTDDEAFAKQVREMMQGKVQVSTDVKPIDMPKSFKPIEDRAFGRRFVDYLTDERGYSYADALKLAPLYDLRYCISGPFKYRLIIPVYMDGLVNWTGRDITGRSLIRYRTLSTDPKKAEEAGTPVAPIPIERTLLNYDEIIREEHGRSLVVCEGPLDALRVDFYGRKQGIRATCLFGTGNLSEAQVELLDAVNDRFEKRLLVLDADAALGVLAKHSRLAYLGYKPFRLPSDIEDPAVLRRSEVRDFFS
jgi:hypothetical protein